MNFFIKKIVSRRWANVLLVLVLLYTANLACADAPSPPRLGKYTVTFFSGPTRSPSSLHELELLDGFKYKVYTPFGKLLSEGTYEVDAKNNVRWLTGLYKDEKYGGTFTIDGNRHQLHMKDRVYARNGVKE